MSSTIKIITSFRIYNQLTLRKENVTQPLEKEVLRFYLKVASNLLFPISSGESFILKITIELPNLTMYQSYNQRQKETLHSINFSKRKTFLPLHQLFYTNIASFGNKNTSLFFSKGEE